MKLNWRCIPGCSFDNKRKKNKFLGWFQFQLQSIEATYKSDRNLYGYQHPFLSLIKPYNSNRINILLLQYFHHQISDKLLGYKDIININININRSIRVLNVNFKRAQRQYYIKFDFTYVNTFGIVFELVFMPHQKNLIYKNQKMKKIEGRLSTRKQKDCLPTIAVVFMSIFAIFAGGAFIVFELWSSNKVLYIKIARATIILCLISIALLLAWKLLPQQLKKIIEI